ncbi:Ppx/GppA phosphatase family protein [Sulfurospirillum multivorans]|uniref:Exopolyphosphatase n=2 Tax=Sulfurospirillum multivorans TaxID=66821 RepID=A0AA86ALA7_SULMK|nr:Ppx/GppA phosphatase family protein [Sulfurospirillum multivorans]AHJ11593.1 putative exopolyphosphatase [Sulfurospirillum multivorans DSM 12446]QEH05093.1 putative exopolyphosphatase [Sulfurospirillum multivorans]
MSKRTAIIDIGSNSARMAIFEKSSRFAFHLINETKSRVRIGEGAYNFDGVLQEPALNRAFTALEEFGHIIKGFKCNKVLCIATSALRDAPNANAFINRVHHELNINIKIIEGTKEAYYGAVGALNYLKEIHDAVTIDIGGGSTELAKIENGLIVETISLNIGTVRLKELFFDKKIPLEKIRAFINEAIEKIPERFTCNDMIGIGGTLRSLSKIIMERTNYPLKTVHGFEYEIASHTSLVNAIVSSDVLGLKNLGVRKDRFDTMREGCIIFQSILQKLSSKTMITSGAGIREGAYLCDLLRSHHHKFSADFKLSLRSFKDRFSLMEEDNLYIKRVSHLLFETLSPLHGMTEHFKYELGVAAELHNIGTKLGFYQNHLHSFYFILNNLNYGFSHEQKILIAMLIKYHVNKLPTQEDMTLYKTLLPDMQTVQWLSFILSLAKAINSDMRRSKISFSYQNHTLTIQAEKRLFLAREQIKQLIKPASFAIIIK